MVYLFLPRTIEVNPRILLISSGICAIFNARYWGARFVIKSIALRLRIAKK